jgi:hypothetical protein
MASTVEHEMTHLIRRDVRLAQFAERKRRSHRLDVEPTLCERIGGSWDRYDIEARRT